MGDKETGSRAALPIWIQFMQSTQNGVSNQNFEVPPTIVEVPVNPHTGAIMGDESEGSVSALFKIGTEPN